MSSQRGNTARTRSQKHKNSFAFKNDLHDKTPLTKFLNTLQVVNVCERCKHILEWKIKYKKYKPITSAKKCTKCDKKEVKHAYHIMCTPCARSLNVCPKCGINKEIIEKAVSVEEQIALDQDIQRTIKILPERKRRTFLRYLKKNKNSKDSENAEDGDKVERTIEDVKARLEALRLQIDGEGEDFDSSDSDSDSDPESE